MNKLQQLHDRAALAISPVALVLTQINIKPDKSKAPGSDGLADVINGFAWYTLLAAAAGFLIGGACWATAGGSATTTPPRAARSGWPYRLASRSSSVRPQRS
jgi:hypothetical protein